MRVKLHQSLLAVLTLASLSSCERFHSNRLPLPLDMYEAKVTEGLALPRGRASHAGGCVKGNVIIAGGSAWSDDRTVKSWFDETLVFDANDKRWIPGPKLPRPLAEMAYACDGEALYIAGGKDGEGAQDEAYRIVRGVDATWKVEPLPRLPVRTNGCAGAILEGVFYVAGGMANDSHDTTAAMWALDTRHPGAGWRACAPIPSPARAYAGLTTCAGKLLLLGGVVGEDPPSRPTRQVFNDFYSYDPSKNAWTRLHDLPSAGQGWSAAAIDDAHLLVLGRADTNIYREIWVVDVADSSTRTPGNLVIQSFAAPLVRLSTNRWWYIGGEPDALKTRTPRVSVIEVSRRTQR